MKMTAGLKHPGKIYVLLIKEQAEKPRMVSFVYFGQSMPARNLNPRDC